MRHCQQIMTGRHTGPTIKYRPVRIRLLVQRPEFPAQGAGQFERAVLLEITLPETIESAGNMPGHAIHGFGFTTITRRIAGIHQEPLIRDLRQQYQPVRSWRTPENRGSIDFFSGGNLTVRGHPGLPATVEHGRGIVTHILQQPPEPGGKGAAGCIIGHDLGPRLDTESAKQIDQRFRRGQGMTAMVGHRRATQIIMHIGVNGARNVGFQVHLATGVRIEQIVTAINGDPAWSIKMSGQFFDGDKRVKHECMLSFCTINLKKRLPCQPLKNKLTMMPGMKIRLSELLAVTVLVTLVVGATGCTTLGYYAQSIKGHFEIMSRRQAVDSYIRDNPGDTVTVEKLRLVRELLGFAHSELLLPDNGSYRSYSDIGRDYVIWNVFAAPALSLEPKQWCYFFVGCLGYRGYYSRDDAVNLYRQLGQEGYDVYMGGVAAYSTLGWFSDPVLNTMLRWDDLYLARIIFHELAHQKLYIRDDTEFNEAFADAVARIGVGLWIEKNAAAKVLHDYLEEQAYTDQFIDLVLKYKRRLEKLYTSDQNDVRKLARKHELLAALRLDYRQLRETWRDFDTYDHWINSDLNNAGLAALTTYRELVPAFMKLYEATNGDLERFYGYVAGLSGCDRENRRRALEYFKNPPECYDNRR